MEDALSVDESGSYSLPEVFNLCAVTFNYVEAY